MSHARNHAFIARIEFQLIENECNEALTRILEQAQLTIINVAFRQHYFQTINEISREAAKTWRSFSLPAPPDPRGIFARLEPTSQK